MVPGLWVVVQGCLDSLLAMVWVTLALFLFLFIFAVIVCTMVGQDLDIRREWSHADLYLGSVWKSMLTILQAPIPAVGGGFEAKGDGKP